MLCSGLLWHMLLRKINTPAKTARIAIIAILFSLPRRKNGRVISFPFQTKEGFLKY